MSFCWGLVKIKRKKMHYNQISRIEYEIFFKMLFNNKSKAIILHEHFKTLTNRKKRFFVVRSVDQPFEPKGVASHA